MKETSHSPKLPPFQYNPISAFSEAFQRRWDFKGRSSRAAYWWILPLLMAMSSILLISIFISASLFLYIGNALIILPLYGCIVCLFYTILIALSLTVRRFHDIGFSGGLTAINYFLSNLLLCIFLFIAVTKPFVFQINAVTKPYDYLPYILGIITLLSFSLMLRYSKKESNQCEDTPKQQNSPPKIKHAQSAEIIYFVFSLYIILFIISVHYFCSCIL